MYAPALAPLLALLLGLPAGGAPAAAGEAVAVPAQGRGSQAGGKKPSGGLENLKRQLKQRRRNPGSRKEFFESRQKPAPRRPAADADPAQGAAAERRPRLEIADEPQRREWFQTADYNGSGWLSYSEAAASLGFDRPRFRAWDEDDDGRLITEEFEAYYRDAVRRNVFVAPTAQKQEGPPPRRSPEQIRNAYDFDSDSVLDTTELARTLSDYGRAALPVERVVRALDADGDERLSLSELGGLPSLLFPVALPPETDSTPDETKPATILDLFGKVEPRGGSKSPSPPRIVGPVPQFRRLDLDDDGFISVRDLEELLRPLHVGVRITTLVNTLDIDRDGVLSEAEFLGAIHGRGDD